MPRSSSWQAKTILVTGGSAGLGKEIARAFLTEGANVVIAARGEQSLRRAEEELSAAVADKGVREVLSLQADVTNEDQVRAMVEQTIARFGRLDVLVNCAGRSTRGEVLATTTEQFAELIDLNFLSAVRCTRAAAEHLLKAGGSVVNIGSLASKFAPRFLGAYPASKFPLAAYSQQLRLELGPRGLHVLLVCPGPIAREEQRTYDSAADPSLPESARRPGGGARLKGIAADWLAGKIVSACRKRKRELIVPWKANLLLVAQAFSTRLGDWLLRRNSG